MATRRSTASALAKVRSPQVPEELRDADHGEVVDDARLEEVRLSGSWLVGHVDGLDIRRSTIAGVQWTGSTFKNLALTDVVVLDSELSAATLSGASLERVRFERCRMSGVVMADSRAKDVVMNDCVMDEAWLRMASLERCELSDCDLRRADLYGATITSSRIVYSKLDESEWAETTLDGVALHGSSLVAAKDLDSLKNVVISSDQIVQIALPVLAARGIVVDDELLDG